MARKVEIGRFHELPVARLVAGGVMLDAGDRELFLPSHQVPQGAEVGTRIEVFVYADKEGQPQATTKQPHARVGEFAYLPCVSVTRAGAFLAWGIPKDLYVPPDEQEVPMREGRSYVVYVGLDHTGERLIGSSRLAAHFDYDVEDIEQGDEVDLLVYGHTDAGVQVVVDQRHRGLVHGTNVFRELRIGSELTGFVDAVRHDNRLDISLHRRGLDGITDAQEVILAALKAAGGSLPLHDRSPPAEIERALGMSKKAFKRGVGGLYKARKIVIEDGGIRLATKSP
jgi:predicted RNA-binding protein (virulence factor B family)